MIYVIGGGPTGLAAGIASGGTVLESKGVAGGHARCFRKDGYTVGYSGHWLFNYSREMKKFAESLVDTEEVSRRTSVMIDGKMYPAPIQGHIDSLGDIAPRIYAEIAARPQISSRSFREWLKANYGDTLFRLFFDPFNEKYMCGAHGDIEPLSNRNDSLPVESLLRGESPAGYNARFIAVKGGIDNLIDKMSSKCDVRINTVVSGIDLESRVVIANGKKVKYDSIIGAIPLNVMANLTGERIELPYLRTLCINVATNKVGFDSHWVYLADKSFTAYRIGSYTLADPSLAPGAKHLVYIDCNVLPSAKNLSDIVDDCVKEVKYAGLIGDVEFVRVLTASPGYALRRSGSTPSINVYLKKLSDSGVFMAGGYGNWMYQGMAKDMEDGFRIGGIVKAL